MIKKLKDILGNFLPKTRTSHPISKLLRPFWEKNGLKRSLVICGLIGLILTNLIEPTTHVFAGSSYTDKEIVVKKINTITTNKTYVSPLPNMLGISQYYSLIHRGVDMRGRISSSVVSIADGVVIQVKEQTFGYGKHIRIAHKGTISSLYAHLSEIEVRVGDKVRQGQEIGKVGLTGWTTGPHLHFEVFEGIKTINPEKLF